MILKSCPLLIFLQLIPIELARFDLSENLQNVRKRMQVERNPASKLAREKNSEAHTEWKRANPMTNMKVEY